jgi:hypothetical protein
LINEQANEQANELTKSSTDRKKNLEEFFYEIQRIKSISNPELKSARMLSKSCTLGTRVPNKARVTDTSIGGHALSINAGIRAIGWKKSIMIHLHALLVHAVDKNQGSPHDKADGQPYNKQHLPTQVPLEWSVYPSQQRLTSFVVCSACCL